jgi:DNA-directed RNA polymerase specialized sigma24 family protein
MKNERNLPLPPGPRYRPTTAPKLDAQLDACVRRGGGLSSGQLGAGNCDALLVQTNRQRERAMSTLGSITLLVRRLTAGDREAARHLFDRYYRRLVGLARARLKGKPRGMAGAEDVAAAAFASFCQIAEANEIDPPLTDRANLWALLVGITANKARNLTEHETAQKRGGGAVRGEEALVGPEDSSAGPGGLDQFPAPDLPPDLIVQVNQEFERLMGLLSKQNLADVALWKMDGDTDEEIAAKLGRNVRSVQRKLDLIRRILAREAAQS